MFGKRFAFGFEGGEQGWTPPWLREEGRGPRHFGHHEHHGQHGFGPGHHGRPFGSEERGWGPPWARGDFRGPHFFGMRRGRGPFGPGGPFGSGGDGPRFFERGDMKFALLALLQERPMHGYEMIKVLEERSGGFYSPSAGSIYPTLQLLEDRGLVTVSEVEGKKVYSITDAGRAFLAERQSQQQQHHQRQGGPEFGPPWMRHHGFGGNRFSPELQALKSEAMEVMRLLTIAGRMSFQDPEQLAKLRAIIEATRKGLADMIYGTQAPTNQDATASSQQQESPTVENA